MKMIKGVTQAGPCLACGASGNYDPEMYDDPEDFIACEFCKGTGYNSKNHVVVEREIGPTDFPMMVKIMNQIYETWVEEKDYAEEEQCEDFAIIETLCTEEAEAGILIARLYFLDEIDRTMYSKAVIERCWESVLTEYDWQHDMEFVQFSTLREGGAGWHEFDEEQWL